MTVDTFVKKALTNWVCLVWTILVERHWYTTNIITRIILSITVPDPILCVMLWNHPRGSSPDNWSASCSAKVFKLLEECNYSFHYNHSYFIQACVPFPFVIAIGNLQFNKTLRSVTCIDCTLYTCLKSSISQKNKQTKKHTTNPFWFFNLDIVCGCQ